MGISGSEVMRVDRDLPDDALPPSYVDKDNFPSFLPLRGTWERTKVNTKLLIAYYYQIGRA